MVDISLIKLCTRNSNRINKSSKLISHTCMRQRNIAFKKGNSWIKIRDNLVLLLSPYKNTNYLTHLYSFYISMCHQ